MDSPSSSFNTTFEVGREITQGFHWCCNTCLRFGSTKFQIVGLHMKLGFPSDWMLCSYGVWRVHLWPWWTSGTAHGKSRCCSSGLHKYPSLSLVFNQPLEVVKVWSQVYHWQVIFLINSFTWDKHLLFLRK